MRTFYLMSTYYLHSALQIDKTFLHAYMNTKVFIHQEISGEVVFTPKTHFQKNNSPNNQQVSESCLIRPDKEKLARYSAGYPDLHLVGFWIVQWISFTNLPDV